MPFSDTSTRMDRGLAYVTRRAFRGLGAVLFVASSALGASTAIAADDAKVPDARARYQSERAICLSGRSNQDRATCLKEAGAALDEARRGRLDNRQGTARDQNALLRCNAVPAADQDACKRRIEGPGVIRGSVAEGGIIRETTEIVPLESTGASVNGAAQDNSAK